MKSIYLSVVLCLLSSATHSAPFQIIEEEVEVHVAAPCVDAVVDAAPWDQPDTERIRRL